MARSESPTKKKQSKATLRALAATKPIPQNFGLGKAARKEAVAIDKKARKARQILGRSIKQEPRDYGDRPKLRRPSDSPPLLGRVEDRPGAATGQADVPRHPSKAKKGAKGDVSKRKQAMKAAKRQTRAKRKAASVQLGARERAKGARRRIEELKRAEQSLERQKEANPVTAEASFDAASHHVRANSSCSPQSSEVEVDDVLNHLEPLLRTIYRIQGVIMASSRVSSFAAASPFPHFIQQKLRKARSIVEMYEGRREGSLSPLEGWALECAQRAVEELEYMRRSDEEERGRKS